MKRDISIFIIGGLIVASVACNDDTVPASESPSPSGAASAANPSTAPGTPTPSISLAPAVEEVEPLANPPVDPKLIASIAAAAASSKYHNSLLKAVYRALNGGPVFVDGTLPNDKARALVALIRDLPSHGVDPKPYGLDGERPVNLEADLTNVTAAAAFDVRLMAATVRYVLEFRWVRTAHPFRLTRDEKEFVTEHKKGIVRDVVTALAVIPDNMKTLWPEHTAYAALRTELARYKALAATTGERENLPFIGVDPGATGDAVKRLQKRLAFEGYYDGPQHGEADEQTVGAIKVYQKSHQLDVDGRVGKGTIRSLNVPMSERVRQLALSLQRWRESRSSRDRVKTYARINLPAFTFELYQDGKEVLRNRVIVGTNRLDANRAKWIQGHLNRTPLMQTRVVQLILNPTWLVPKRIRLQEIDPATESNPSLYEEKGYKEITLSNGDKRLVQESGRKNALGRVKFILEKTDAIFMHDTDKPWLFRKTIRDFSHGCMRLDNALDLAKRLSNLNEGTSEERFDRLLGSGRPQPVTLKRPLDLYVEYNTVDIVDGRPVFLVDVYKYDRYYHKGYLPPRKSIRYGADTHRPAKVPYIPHDAYQELKAQGGPAPLSWPPAPVTDEG